MLMIFRRHNNHFLCNILGLKPMVYPIMWSAIETDGVKDSAVIERFKKIGV